MHRSRYYIAFSFVCMVFRITNNFSTELEPGYGVRFAVVRSAFLYNV